MVITKVVVSHKHKYVYYYVPKVACTTIRKMLANFDEFEYIKRQKTHELPYFKFAFARNPWDRLVSCYADKVVGAGLDPVNNERNGVFKSFTKYKRDFKNMEFAEFAEFVCETPDRKSNSHFRSQYKFMPPLECLNFMGRFENLTADLQRLREMLGIAGVVEGHFMRSTRKSYRHYYDNRLMDMVGQRYRRDITTFGYTY